MTRPFPLPPALCNAVIATGCCPSQRLAMQGTQAHPSSQRAACSLVGISKFSLEMRNWLRDEAVYPRPCWKLEAGTRVNPNIQCAHTGLFTFLSLEKMNSTEPELYSGFEHVWEDRAVGWTSIHSLCFQRSGFGQTSAPARLLLPWGSILVVPNTK